MTFTINDFQVQTEKRKETLNEQIAMPTSISRKGQPIEYTWQNKTREFNIFSRFLFKYKKDNQYYPLIKDLFEFIDLIEILKAFNGNKLDTQKEYEISTLITVKTAQKNGNMYLKIGIMAGSKSVQDFFLDKFECSSLAAKFGKILQRCEAWQE